MYSHRKELTSDVEATTQDGSNSSDGLLHSLETKPRKTMSWMYLELLMLKTEISTCTNSMVKLTNNGISSMPRTGRENQPLVNGIENTVSLSTKTSISSPLSEEEDILIILVEISFLRLRMVEQARNGTSINHQELSDPDQLTNHSTSTTLVNPITCNTTALHQDGGRCSSIRADISETFKTARLLPCQDKRTLKVNQFGYGTDMLEDTHHKSGEFPIFTRKILETPTPRRVMFQEWASVSKLILHSTSDPDFQCRELLNVSVPVTLP